MTEKQRIEARIDLIFQKIAPRQKILCKAKFPLPLIESELAEYTVELDRLEKELCDAGERS